ncbi:MAG: hypothetical protein WCD79_17620 [Chthoniobacteraceae bacterium]
MKVTVASIYGNHFRTMNTFGFFRVAIGMLTSVVIFGGWYARGQEPIPKGYVIPDDTRSPDHRYGVLVPDTDYFIEHNSDPDRGNQVVEMRTGRVVGEIKADTGWTRQNHGGINPSIWSKDNSVLLWEVDGKWSPDALVILKIEGEKIKWQLDLLTIAQRAVLARTKQADPKKYAVQRKWNAGNGSDYPDGFTVNVTTSAKAGEPLKFPAAVQVYLTSDPKEIQAAGKILSSEMEGVVDKDGKFTVTKFNIVK